MIWQHSCQCFGKKNELSQKKLCRCLLDPCANPGFVCNYVCLCFIFIKNMLMVIFHFFHGKYGGLYSSRAVARRFEAFFVCRRPWLVFEVHFTPWLSWSCWASQSALASSQQQSCPPAQPTERAVSPSAHFKMVELFLFLIRCSSKPVGPSQKIVSPSAHETFKYLECSKMF